VSRASKKRD